MKKSLSALCALFLCFSASAQDTPLCYCPTESSTKRPTKYPPNTKATKIFDLGNGKSIALCGYEEKELIKHKTLFSEFVLSECSSAEAIGFWGAIETCDVKAVKDTVLVEMLKLLPRTPAAKETYFTWTTERLYYTGNKLNRTLTINPNLPKYSAPQIAAVLNLYNH